MKGCGDVKNWTPADGDSRCQSCGHTYYPWVTDNPLWNHVMGGEEATSDPGGYLCPECFMDRADRTYAHPIIWRVVPMWRKP